MVAISFSTSSLFKLLIVALIVEFTSGQFTGSESSGSIEVVVRITGGSSSDPITVTVTPSVQSPVSAIGMYVCHNLQGYQLHVYVANTTPCCILINLQMELFLKFVH